MTFKEDRGINIMISDYRQLLYDNYFGNIP